MERAVGRERERAWAQPARFAHQTASKFASAGQLAREGTPVAREWTEKTWWGWLIFSPGADKGDETRGRDKAVGARGVSAISGRGDGEFMSRNPRKAGRAPGGGG